MVDLLIDRYHYIRDMLLCIGTSHYSHINDICMDPINYDNIVITSKGDISVTIHNRVFRLCENGLIEYITVDGRYNNRVIMFCKLDENRQRKLQDILLLLDSCLLQLMRCAYLSDV